MNPNAVGLRWRALAIIAAANVLAMATWFSATAVITQVAATYGIAPQDQGWITAAVQLGFVTGALLSSVIALPDVVAPRTLMRIGMLVAAVANIGIAFTHSVPLALALRFLTGAGLAIVYPPAVKLLSAWFARNRGLATGILIGALTLGSFSPHLLSGAAISWQSVIIGSSILAAIGIPIISLLPATPAAPPLTKFEFNAIPKILKDRGVLLADCAYWGHMWELYAAWAWAPVFFQASLIACGSHSKGGLWIFIAFGLIGALGCIVAGVFADRLGRSAVAAGAMIVSGTLSLTIGFTFGLAPWLVITALMIWGFSVIADSAQFSAAVTELAAPAYVGTALTLQMGIGFLITLATIWLIGTMHQIFGWRHVFGILAIGPALGAWSMLALRRRPEAVKMAHGHR
ncbi:MAG: MFS transporter [Candidatus Eremiobacteraeota bacterium]|nr:MFS transporter [Candidatus Eremiobacteraeota bacterium]